LVDRDNPFHAGGDLRRTADLILSRSRITRSELCIVDPDVAQPRPPSPPSRVRHHDDDVACRPPPPPRPRDRRRPASDCLPADRLTLRGDVPGWTVAVNGQAAVTGECRVQDAAAAAGAAPPSSCRAVIVTVVSPRRRTVRLPCCAVS